MTQGVVDRLGQSRLAGIPCKLSGEPSLQRLHQRLAVLLPDRKGRDVILIDADDQETASDFTILRNERQADASSYTSIKLTGAAVRTETLRLREKYQDIIIDTGGRDTTSQRAALTVADMLLVPFVPRSFDVWTLEKVGALVTENARRQSHAFGPMRSSTGPTRAGRIMTMLQRC